MNSPMPANEGQGAAARGSRPATFRVRGGSRYGWQYLTGMVDPCSVVGADVRACVVRDVRWGERVVVGERKTKQLR